jgi:hypothetical protein
MLPVYLVDEFALRLSARRLQPSKLKAVCRILGIDLDAALHPEPSAETAAQHLYLGREAKFIGHIPFDFETRCGNNVRRVPGRVIYASSGLEPDGQIGFTVSECQALSWDIGEPAPSWEHMPENTLPDGLVHRLSEAVLDAITEKQRQQSGTENGSEA